MAWNGWVLAESVMAYKIPTLGLPEGINHLPLAISGILIALFSLEHIVALLRGEDVDPVMALTILCVVFTLCLMLGVPVAFSIGLSAVATILYEGLPLAVVFQRMTSGMNIFSFLAIPFFIFAGELMLYGGVADRIVAFAKSLVGHVRGGLGMANVVACTLFGGVSGSPVADVSAMGAVMIPMMKKEGYHADYAVNVTTHAALVGALMPTSHNMIIYSLAAGGKVSITALILAGMVPAALLMICNAGGRLPGGDPARLPGRHLPGLERRAVVDGRRHSRPVRGGDHPDRHPVRRLHRHRIGRGRGDLCAGCSPSSSTAACNWENFLKAAAKAVKTTGIVLLLIGVSNDLRLPDQRSTRWPISPARRWRRSRPTPG